MRGDLKDVLRDLLKLGREQKRCGLDKPDEETQARIRDLVQAGTLRVVSMIVSRDGTE